MNPQSAQDLVKAGFYGYQGWDDAGALADFKATGGAGKGSSTVGAITQSQPTQSNQSPQNFGNNAIGLANQALQTYQPYVDKAAGFINQGMDKINSSYQGLLDSIKKRTEMNVADEYGRRGIPVSSGIVGQAQNEQVTLNQAPIYASLADKTNTGYGNLASLYSGVGNFLQSIGIGDASVAQAVSAANRAPIGDLWGDGAQTNLPQLTDVALNQQTTNPNNYNPSTQITGYPGVQRLADGSPAILGLPGPSPTMPQGGQTAAQTAGFRAQQTAQEELAQRQMAQALYPSIFNLFGLLQR